MKRSEMTVVNICDKNTNEEYYCVFTEKEMSWLRACGISTATWARMALNLFGWEAVMKFWA